MGLSKHKKNKLLSFILLVIFLIILGIVLFWMGKTRCDGNLLKNNKKIIANNLLTAQNQQITPPAGPIVIKATSEGGYTLYVGKEPFLAKGVGYNPTPIGKGYTYDFFQDESKPWLVDGKLMQKAGINCVRIYTTSKDLDKVKLFIREMYENFGIYTIVSDWLGLWNYPRANYADKNFQESVKQKMLTIVEALKDEKGLLMWMLGNENNYTFSGKIGFWTSPEIEKIEQPAEKQVKRAEIYYSFVNEIASSIKAIDKSHPVALGNGEANFLGVAANTCNDIDILAIIIYRGKTFGNLFNTIRNTFNKPIILSEFGCESFDAYKKEENQDIQSDFLLAQWKELYANTTLSGNKAGNCIGGCSFEWTDEWWKHNEGYADDWKIHNQEAGWSHGAYFFDIRSDNNLNMNEEWFGIISLSKEMENGINKRTPKKSFYTLKNFFSNLQY